MKSRRVPADEVTRRRDRHLEVTTDLEQRAYDDELRDSDAEYADPESTEDTPSTMMISHDERQTNERDRLGARRLLGT